MIHLLEHFSLEILEKRSGAALRIIFAIASGNSFLTVVKLAKSDIGNCQNCFLLFWPFRGDFYQFAQFFSTPCNQVSDFWNLIWLDLIWHLCRMTNESHFVKMRFIKFSRNIYITKSTSLRTSVENDPISPVLESASLNRKLDEL